MTATIDMKIVLRTLRGARSLAIETLKRDFPDIYDLSADAFEISATGSINHHIRLGEFLTEWDNHWDGLPSKHWLRGSATRCCASLLTGVELATSSTGRQRRKVLLN